MPAASPLSRLGKSALKSKKAAIAFSYSGTRLATTDEILFKLSSPDHAAGDKSSPQTIEMTWAGVELHQRPATPFSMNKSISHRSPVIIYLRVRPRRPSMWAAGNFGPLVEQSASFDAYNRGQQDDSLRLATLLVYLAGRALCYLSSRLRQLCLAAQKRVKSGAQVDAL